MRLRRWLSRAGVASVMTTIGAALLHAQQTTGEFVPVPKGELGQEMLPATPLVFIAYAFVWVAMIVYVISLVRRIGRVEHELGDLRSKLPADKRG
jgi:CcmD family protein